MTKFPQMALDGRMFHFTSADIIRLLLEALLKEGQGKRIKIQKKSCPTDFKLTPSTTIQKC
jgi:hypothetical protein